MSKSRAKANDEIKEIKDGSLNIYIYHGSFW